MAQERPMMLTTNKKGGLITKTATVIVAALTLALAACAVWCWPASAVAQCRSSYPLSL
jgi:hypothetical protein